MDVEPDCPAELNQHHFAANRAFFSVFPTAAPCVDAAVPQARRGPAMLMLVGARGA
jgi:hypothetical protein